MGAIASQETNEKGKVEKEVIPSPKSLTDGKRALEGISGIRGLPGKDTLKRVSV